MRQALHRLHQLGALLAGVFLVAVGALTLVPIVARLAGWPAHSWDEVATYCMAASAFLGLACTWRSGVHVRMELLINRFQGPFRKGLEILALVITLTACGYFTWFASRFAKESFQMNDMSQGLLPIPLWIPQSSMVIGLVLLCMAIGESLFDAIHSGQAPVNTDAVMNRAVNEL
jgi:TRAP-type C4-dicarboxylate transport system permease small subunit